MVTVQKVPDGGTTTAKHKIPDTDHWLTRNEAADLLMVSSQTLANYERKGILHPQYAYRRDACGIDRRVVLYDPQELTKCPRYNRTSLSPRSKEPGEIAARAFELFREGRTSEDVVVELRVQPDVARDLRDKWLDMGGADLVISPGAKEALEKIVGSFKSVADLVECVQKLGLTPAS